MAKSFLKTASSWSKPALRTLRVDRFDTVMIAAISVLMLAIGGVIVHGDQLTIHRGSNALVLYTGPYDARAINLWAIDPNKPDARQQITNSSYGLFDFDTAQNGLVVYSEQTKEGTSNLMQYDPARGDLRTLYDCKDATCMEVAVRPDGKMVAFDYEALNTGTDLPPGAPRIWLYDMASGQAAPLYKSSQQLGYQARWSPDGQKLAFFDANVGAIVVHDFATGKDVDIQAFQGSVGRFSPDGRSIWFPKTVQANDQVVTHIVIADLSSDPVVQHDLIPDTAGSDDIDPIWMPDGKTLIMPRRMAGTLITQDKQIYRVDVATGQASPLVVDPKYAHTNLSLNAAGDQLIFERYLIGGQGAKPEIWLYDFKTATTRKLVDNASNPHWLP